MQENILFFFQNHSNPFFDAFFETMSFLAEQYFFIAIFSLIYWNISKKQGFALTFTFLLSTGFNQLLKLIFHTPRPYQVIEKIKGKRLFTAGGYAFPSGHTQGATTFYISLAEWLKKFWIWVLAIIISILVGISRLYLGVHWPIDVIGAWFLGIIFAFWCYRYVLYIMEKSRKFIVLIVSINVVVLFILAYLYFYHSTGNAQTNFSDFIKIAAIIMGSSLGYLAEIKTYNYSVKGAKTKKWIRYIIGLIGAIALLYGLKWFNIQSDGFLFFRYFLVGAWITFFFPLLGAALRLFQRE